MQSILKKLLFTNALFALVFSSPNLFSQNVLGSGVTVATLMNTQPHSVRIAIDKSTGRMFYTTVNGKVYEVQNWNTTSPSAVILSDVNAHGIETQMAGMCVANNTIYICGNNDYTTNSSTTVGIIKKADLSSGTLNWTTVGITAPYALSNTAFDHRMNCIKLDPSGQWLYINSGSRSDHGEAHNGVRETPLTARILRIPANSVNLFLPNDSAGIAPYTYCVGVRNTFGMAFNHDGYLFGTENSGDRDHPEELNWLREGRHYGFPWDLGGFVNPQQFPTYQPGSGVPNDGLIPPSSTAWSKGYFYNDPTFLQKPTTLTLTSPIVNEGPHANRYRDSATGVVVLPPAGKFLTTFSPHLSPAGLVFDNDFKMGGQYTGGCFVVNFTNGGMANDFNIDNSNGALMFLNPYYDAKTDNFRTSVSVLANQMGQLTDVEIFDNHLFIISYQGNSPGKIYKVTLPQAEKDTYKAQEAINRPTINGIADEHEWARVLWQPLNNLYVDNVSGNENTMPDPSDASGRYKALWKGSELFILAEITDNVLQYTANAVNASQVFGGDALEIFIDEDNSGGAHTKTHNAFAYHISPDGKVADQCGCGQPNDYVGNSGNWNGVLFNDVAETKVIKNGNVYTWEVAIKVYDSLYTDGGNNSNRLVNLTAGKKMGFGVAYNDYDVAGTRRSLIGSFSIPGTNNGIISSNNLPINASGGRNIAWQDASVFGKIDLLGQPCLFPIITIPTLTVNTNTNAGPFLLQPTIDYIGNDLRFQLFTTTSSLFTASVNPLSGQINIVSVFGHGFLNAKLQARTGCRSLLYDLNISSCGEPDFYYEFDTNLVYTEDNMNPFTLTPFQPFYNAGMQFTLTPLRTSFAYLRINRQSGAITVYPIPGQSGVDYLTVTGANNCEGNNTKSLRVRIERMGSLSATNEWLTNTPITMHPNPATEKIYFTGLKNSTTVVVKDVHGKMINSKAIAPDEPMDINYLAQGVYIVVLESPQNSHVFRLIKP